MAVRPRSASSWVLSARPSAVTLVGCCSCSGRFCQSNAMLLSFLLVCFLSARPRLSLEWVRSWLTHVTSSGFCQLSDCFVGGRGRRGSGVVPGGPQSPQPGCAGGGYGAHAVPSSPPPASSWANCAASRAPARVMLRREARGSGTGREEGLRLGSSPSPAVSGCQGGSGEGPAARRRAQSVQPRPPEVGG